MAGRRLPWLHGLHGQTWQQAFTARATGTRHLQGDIEGARSTLEEVMEAGSDEQKRQAEELLHQNG